LSWVCDGVSFLRARLLRVSGSGEYNAWKSVSSAGATAADRFILCRAGARLNLDRNNLMPKRENLFRTSNPAAAGCNSGRARVPARREQVYVINLVKGGIWSVLDVDKIPRPRDESDVAKRSGRKGHPEKGYVGQAAIPPGRRSGCVTSITLRGRIRT